MRSLHLSGNPGITLRLKQYLHKRAHCLEEIEQNTINMQHLPSNKSHDHSVPEDLDKKHQETTLLKMINKYKQVETAKDYAAKN